MRIVGCLRLDWPLCDRNSANAAKPQTTDRARAVVGSRLRAMIAPHRRLENPQMNVIAGVALVVGIVVVAIVATVAVIGRLRTSRDRHGSSGALSRAVLELDAMFDPGKRHIVKAADKDAGIAEEDDAGAAPAP
jgi:hypothetical protein